MGLICCSSFWITCHRSLLGPLTDQGKVIGVIFLAVAFGIALKRHKDRPLGTLKDVVDLSLEALVTILHWIIDVVPFAVLGLVASIVKSQGFEPLQSAGRVHLVGARGAARAGQLLPLRACASAVGCGWARCSLAVETR